MITTKVISEYWDKQATIWAEEKKQAWEKEETQYWLGFFKDLHSSLSGNRVLEVGTASGYFANILTLAGYDVTAIDYSVAMISEAKLASRQLGINVNYSVMDAQDLDFGSNTFDLVFTRLMTWTLPDVDKFYASAFRVLKKGGTLLNFDGDFGEIQFSQEGHENYPKEIMEEANLIKKQLFISSQTRPNIDISMLKSVGFEDISIDFLGQNRILHIDSEESSLFKLSGIKPNI